MKHVFLIFLVSFLFIVCIPSKVLCDDNPLDINEQIYIKLFQQKRAEQLHAVKSMQKFNNYEKQYAMILKIAQKVFLVIQESRALIEASSYIPGVSPFPTEDLVKNALSSILENTALFSEIVLRFPDISESVLKTSNNWDVLLQWSIAFSNQVSYLIGSNTQKLLDLVKQELRHVERDPAYINPYRKENQKQSKNEEDATINQKTKKKKKKIEKGPRIARTDL